MGRLFFIMAGVSALMVILAGAGTFLISNTIVAQSKVDAVSSTAKGIALALSEQVNLLDNVLDKMAQDPEVVAAAVENNPDLLSNAARKLETHFPGVLSVKFLTVQDMDPKNPPRKDMGFADAEMARKTFEKNQPSAIQGDVNANRHLAIARRILQNNATVGVVLVGVDYEFINRILNATPLERGYIELKQDKLTLASTGKKNGADALETPPIRVPNTEWDLYFENSGTSSAVEYSLISGIILIPALIVALAFTTGYRKISNILSDDAAWVIKAFKDIVTEKPLGEYHVKLAELKHVITNLAQFKRIVKDKSFEI